MWLSEFLQRIRRPRGTHGLICVALAAGIAIAATIGGIREMTSQLTAAPLGKSSVITLIINFGFVLIGPALFAAVAMLTPWRWPRHEKRRPRPMIAPQGEAPARKPLGFSVGADP